MQEIYRSKPMADRVLKTDSISFSAIPGQSKLFTRYQEEPLSLRKFYPSVIESHTQAAARIPEVLSNYKTDRSQLCDALAEINTIYGAGPKTFANIDLLREENTVAIVTGQQAGLFTGPLYSIYKALSAVKMAECLRGRGFKAVPVFWAATEDHDFEEISSTVVLGKDHELRKLQTSENLRPDDKPVGSIILDRSISVTINELFDALPETEFSGQLRKTVEAAYAEGYSFGDAFGIFLARVLGDYGLIILDPLNERLKKLAAPIYAEAAEKSSEIVAALIERSADLERNDYHAQVLVNEDYFPFFWHSDDGSRKPLKKIADGLFRLKNEKTQFTTAQLAAAASSEPQRFSPGVMLRPVVQDYLLPTLCYFGGGAEIAYFAQNSVVYQILGRPVTPILHRQSITIVEARQTRIFAKYGLTFTDLFPGFEKLLPRIVEKTIDPQTGEIFVEIEEKISKELNRLDQTLSLIDPTLAENLATRHKKILYHIAGLRKKFHRVQIEKNDIVNRQIRSSFSALLPNGHLQERVLNVTSFLDRYGVYFIDWVYDSIDLDDKGHRIIYL
ncbi:MAG: bacillithiol biosynthesis cysteine-adding enzyme BshC [Acidobacteriota bacterium]|nr:bacillithiol biosynthesis cysteine-adding enzyme BshC [Acidobacteriota bacterium]